MAMVKLEIILIKLSSAAALEEKGLNFTIYSSSTYSEIAFKKQQYFIMLRTKYCTVAPWVSAI